MLQHEKPNSPASPGCPVDHKALMAVAGMRAGTPASPGICPVSSGAAGFNPFEGEYQVDPAASLRWSRAEEPVFFSPEIGYYVVSRYADVKAVFRDNILFSPSVALEKITPVSREAEGVLRRHNYGLSRTLVNEDEPAHMPRRRILMEPFTAPELKHHEPMVRQLARDYVDRFIDTGKADLVDEMLWEVPLTVALHFLGIPEEDMGTMRKYSIAHTVNTWGRPSPAEQIKVAEAVGNFWSFAGEVLEKMRRDPSGPGWMPYAIRIQADQPEIITDSYLHSMMMAGIVAAHETTANASANALRLLLEHREVWKEICADPSLIPNAVEECLRHSGSVAAWRRIATAPTRIGDVDIPEGARLLIVNSSANHDERHFDNPDDFDIRRENASDHLTFGYGSHQCMGKDLARMEMQIFLEEFTARLPHMELVPDQEFTYLPNTSFRGPDHVLVQWDPRENPERRDASVLSGFNPVKIGQPSRQTITRTITIEAVEKAADNVLRLRLADGAGKPLPGWTPGSHLDILFNDLSRQYSLCGSGTDTSGYEIAVLEEAGGRGGSRFIHQNFAVGQTLKVRGPRNHFRLEDAENYIFIAGGIGITPIIAMADSAKALGRNYEIHYTGRSHSTMALLDRLRNDHGDRLTLYTSASGGKLDVADLLREARAETQIYGCGPARLLDSMQEETKHWPAGSLHVEHFVSTLEALDPTRERSFEVELKDSGLTIQVPADQTVLQALRSANIEVKSDCEEGICGTCEVPVLEGRVDHRDLVLTDAEKASNKHIMTCCSRACSTKLVLDL